MSLVGTRPPTVDGIRSVDNMKMYSQTGRTNYENISNTCIIFFVE